ncbi:MAG: site-specific DNA-methyltransferase [Gemmatimonadaceae bacterium]|nr:site-specific DNA-methyltransferase [Gemmatimonadaceae bacterium]
MEKLQLGAADTKSADVVTANMAALRALYPEAFVEGKIDFDVLRHLLGGAVDEREEKYGLNWHGKRRARQLALTPSTGTLRPAPGESVDWETTQNLMIEGDNLEVLKLLQKSYSGKVKLIYIDPPYNTGKDFVYPDDFRDNIRNYLELTGQVEGGKKITSNPESSGRFHTDWLNMMYPRLKLARALLAEDGALFASIDDEEFPHLRAVMDAVFGEENFVGAFVWEKRTTRENRRVLSVNHDYLLCYARELSLFEQTRGLLPRTIESEERFDNPDQDPRGAWQSVSINAQAGPGRRKEQFFTIVTPSGRRVDPPSGRCWIFTEDRFHELVADRRIWFGEDGNNVPRLKVFRSESNDGVVPHTLWKADEVGTTDSAKKALKDLFDGIEVFDTPKPIGLLERILAIGATGSPNDVVLDFFAGAGPVGEAVLYANARDGGRRKYLLVQLPEPLPDDSPGRSLGLENLAQVVIERLRRAAKKIRDENPLFAGDLGFRVFKLDSSNIRAWEPRRDDLEQTLLESQEHIKPGRGEQDVLYELLLKLGLELTVPIQTRTIAGKSVHSVGGGVLMVCLSESVAADEVEALAEGIVAWHKELQPAGEVNLVFRDSAFANDVAKTNLTAILQQQGLGNVKSV